MVDERTDVLISRAVEGEARAAEWDELEMHAELEPELWRTLGAVLRDHGTLRRLVERAETCADAVEIAPSAGDGVVARPWRLHRWGAWTGWAVAAVVALAWSLGSGGAADSGGADAPSRGTLAARDTVPAAAPSAVPDTSLVAAGAPDRSADELLDAYLEQGRAEDRVIREMPRMVLLETRPNPSGDGFEIVYLRQLMERAVVPDLYHFDGQDESGRPTLVRYQRPRHGEM